jgi:tetratricopeptide (TPR) repeat protein
MLSRYCLALCLSAQGRFDEAIELRRIELEWSREQKGDSNSSTLMSIKKMAIDLYEAGELQEAEVLFRELVSAIHKVHEPDDLMVGSVLCGLARTLAMAGKLEEALDFRQQALGHSINHEGPDSWGTNNERLEVSRLLHMLERNQEAIGLLIALVNSMGRNDGLGEHNHRLVNDAMELLQAIEEQGG